jgi:hypothetical protein
MNNGFKEEREITEHVIEPYDPEANVVTHTEIIITESDTQDIKRTITRYRMWACGHGRAYGFTCGNCGSRWCSDCYQNKRYSYCYECGITLCPHCYSQDDSRHYCSEHDSFWRRITQNPSVMKELAGIAFMILVVFFLLKAC